mgnify:CR=1 FL=1
MGAIGGIGGVAAENIVKARSKGPFISREDLRNRAKISNTAVEVLADLGVLEGLPETDQIELFEGFPCKEPLRLAAGVFFLSKKGGNFSSFCHIYMV